MRVVFRLMVAAVCLVASTRAASAHFLWLHSDAAKSGGQVQLWFSETCVPGDSKLLEKVSHSKAWCVQPGGAASPLSLTKQESGDTGGWAAAIERTAGCIEATCDYGVISRGGDTFLLQYHARSVPAGDVSRAPTTKKLPLDLTARQENGELVFQAAMNGKPAADAQLVVIGPNNEEKELKVDGRGEAHIPHAAAGDYAARARVQLDQAGDRDGKHYDQVRHYTTLTFRLPESQPVELAAAATPIQPEAKEMLRRARGTRAVWESFPGFTADVSVTIDGKTEKGKLTVDDSGVTTVTVADEALKNWAEQTVESLVQHRMPASFGEESPTFADDDSQHPLGRKILLGDADYQSAYRIRDDMITEVNRKAGPTHFTISVLETERNSAGKYLPKVVTLTTWDASDKLLSNNAVLNTWTHVGNYDVPDRQFEVYTAPGKREVRELLFTNYRLTDTKK